MTRYISIPLQWKALRLAPPGNGFGYHYVRASHIERRLARILGEWERTPYDIKFAEKGVGVYCTAFIARVLDELYGQDPTPLLKIPDDIAFHSTEGAFSGLKWFMRQYPTCERITDGVVEPGNVIIVGPVGGGPGHAMMVGPRENALWQASGSGVHYTGFALPDTYQFFAAYKFTDCERWFRRGRR